MNREEIQKILGGYATGTLTPEERQALFAAALDDQDLFDALGREQSLRDLLRDPGAKAELLAALGTPKGGGFWAWLHSPLVAGLAMACVAAVAVVSVWQGTQVKPLAPAPMIVAELKSPEKMKAPETKPLDAAPALRQDAPMRPKRESMVRRDATDAVTAATGKKEIAPTINAPAPPAPPPPAPPRGAALGTVTETVSVEPTSQAVSVSAQPLAKEKLTPEARALFYGNGLAQAKNALVPPLIGGSAGAQSAGASMRAATGKKDSAVSNLGVRVSILRGDVESAVTTLLDPGESVRLKLTPNEDGFFYVAAREGDVWKMLASGPAQRLKPFETPPLPFTGSGQKQLYVMLSRQAQTLTPQSMAGMAGLKRANLMETLADQDRAMEVAAVQNSAPQQVVEPITLTYR